MLCFIFMRVCVPVSVGSVLERRLRVSLFCANCGGAADVSNVNTNRLQMPRLLTSRNSYVVSKYHMVVLLINYISVFFIRSI